VVRINALIQCQQATLISERLLRIAGLVRDKNYCIYASHETKTKLLLKKCTYVVDVNDIAKARNYFNFQIL